MASTPLIKPLNVQGGTFLTFSSAAEDISKTFSDDNARFVFSKFVSLNLPEVAAPVNRKNSIVWESIGIAGGTSSVPISSLSTNQNINFAQSFQNYVLNYEELVLKGKNQLGVEYDTDEKSTITERLFWNWLAKINAIRFTNANTTNESNESNRYKEEPVNAIGATQYQRVVEYIGDIDVVNNISKNGHSYSEIYMHIPTSHGNTPLILWKQYQDNNYKPNLYWTGSSEYIEGRSSSSTHPSGLDLIAYYDYDLGNRYLTPNLFGDVSNQSYTVNSKSIYISSADGLVLDFNPETYKPITSNKEIETIIEYNTVAESIDFKINAILVYYDIYDVSSPDDRFTNLYGILILDDYINTVDGGNLKSFDKFKPNPITKLNGNSYGIKLNIKFDTSVDNAAVETIINEYNTFSMDLFMDASIMLKDSAEMFLEQKVEYINLESRVTELEKFYYVQDDLTEVERRMTDLEQFVQNSSLAFQSATSLLDLINNNNDKINTIMNGQTPLQIAYNLDVIDNGDGIFLDKTVPNKIKIVNNQQEYQSFGECLSVNGYFSYSLNNGTIPIYDPNNSKYSEDNNVLTLGIFKNYFKNTAPSEQFVDDLIVNIDDTNIKWKSGQVYRISFTNSIDLNFHNIIFRTDATNKFLGGVFNKQIGIIRPVDLISEKPIIDIICKSEDTYEFYIDIIK